MNAYEAFLKSMVAANFKLPSQPLAGREDQRSPLALLPCLRRRRCPRSILLSLGSPAAKSEFVSSGAARQLLEMGHSVKSIASRKNRTAQIRRG